MPLDSLARTMNLLLGDTQWLARATAISPANQIAFYYGNEASGTTIIDHSIQTNNGTYSGVDLQNTQGAVGWRVPFWDAANDYADVYSAGMASDFSGAKGAIAAWFKVYNSGVWTDGISRDIVRLLADGNNYILISKYSVANRILITYKSGGLAASITATGVTSTDWMSFVMNWEDNANGDRFQFFLNGVQVSTDQTGFGAFAGTIAAASSLIGASSKTPTGVFNGWIMPCAIWAGYNLTAADIATWSTT